MRVDYQFMNKSWSYLHYDQFSVGSASEEYPLTVGAFSGVGTDWFAAYQLNRTKFSTPDNDNDNDDTGKCADAYNNGWWYNNCTNATMQGLLYMYTAIIIITHIICSSLK